MTEEILRILLLLLLGIGIYDIVLAVKGKNTLSQTVEGLLPRAVDVGIVVGLLVLAWIYGEWIMAHLLLPMNGASYFLHALVWTLVGHMLLGHELYKKFHP